MWTFQSIALVAFAGFLVKQLLQSLSTTIRRRNFARDHGCMPRKSLHQPDKYLGLHLVHQLVKSYKARAFLDWWEQQLTRTGKTFQFWVLGQRMLLTSDPENIRTILTSSIDDFEQGPRRRSGFAPLVGNGIFAVDGEDWHRSRALLRPSFAKDQMNDTDLFETHYQDFLRLLPMDGDAVDLQGLLNSLTTDTATDLLFGSPMGYLKDSENMEVRRFSSACTTALSAVWRDISLGPLNKIFDRESGRARRFIHETIDCHVRRVLDKGTTTSSKTDEKPASSKGERYVFLEHLAERTQDPVVLRDQALSALLGGRETTASLLSHLLYILARRPEVWDKLRAEAQGFFGQALNQDTIRNAVFLSRCINEALRLRPVIPVNARWSNKDTILPRGGGSDGSAPILVPKGSQVSMTMYHMHRDIDNFGDDAHAFKPERWETLKPGWSYAPFGGGPRLCIGQQLALTETTYTMLRILQTFKAIAAADDEPWREDFSITLNCATGCRVRLFRA